MHESWGLKLVVVPSHKDIIRGVFSAPNHYSRLALHVVLKSTMKLASAPKVLLVGSGLYALTLAERITSQFQISVRIVEKRSHIGGNAYSEFDKDTGIEVHKYGSHLFHTSNKAVWDYLNQFTSFTSYQHTVWANHKSYLHSLPINLATINSFFKKSFTPSEARALIAEQSKEVIGSPQNLEQKAISAIGRPLYEAFIRGYTEKQWQTDPRELDESIINRLPVRFNLTNRYFKDTYEGLPSIGYTAMMEKMVENPLIEISLNTDFFDIKDSIPEDTLCIYTGPIDRYFNYKHGRLAWRTLDFTWETLPVDDFQGTSVVNYVDSDVPYTRIHEFQHLHPERKNISGKTIIAREYSRFCETEEDEPYYPVNSSEDRAKLELYRKEIAKLPNTIFGGRLGSYQYLDMHMAIASALSAFQNVVVPWIEKSKV